MVIANPNTLNPKGFNFAKAKDYNPISYNIFLAQNKMVK
jgi:hypothetical protein